MYYYYFFKIQIPSQEHALSSFMQAYHLQAFVEQAQQALGLQTRTAVLSPLNMLNIE